MSVFHYNYNMEISFDAPCREHHFSLMCYPIDNRRQKILNRKIEIFPACEVIQERDWAGNIKILGLIEQEHTRFSVSVEGDAETYANFYEDKEIPPRYYKYPTSLTAAGGGVCALAVRVEGNSDYEKSLSALKIAHAAIAYRSGTTDVSTSAEQALSIGYGVCQDYAHILLAILKRIGIPCRYVAGIVKGEGYSHAWVEVNCNGFWYALDPTSGRLVGDGYLKFSHGRDCSDTAINRGSLKGFANQKQSITAYMTAEDSPSADHSYIGREKNDRRSEAWSCRSGND